MRLLLSIILTALLAPTSHAMSWVWMPPESYVKESTLIAIGTIGVIHDTVSPEEILVRSATVKIDQVLFWRFAADQPAPTEIILYEVDPNNGTVVGGSLFRKTDSGRCFLFLQVRGFGKFCPYDRLSVQKLEKEFIYWPTGRGKTEEVSVQRVITELKALLK